MAAIVRARDFKIRHTFYLDSVNSVLANLTGATLKTIFKLDINETDANALFTKLSSSAQITILSQTTNQGQCETIIPAVDGAKFLRNKIYFECVAKLTSGEIISNGVEVIDVNANLLKTLF